jgi:hypothetical protein
MVTSHIRWISTAVALSALLPACTGEVTSTEDPGNDPPGQPESEPFQPTAPDLAYPGKGFIVHEWGTDTVVIGSDGSLQRGLHHEEEDLPGFVYDRIKTTTLDGSYAVTGKIETPVTYFYSDKALKVTANVGFPKGVFTQWYPAVQGFYPLLLSPGIVPGLDVLRDPALDPDFPFASELCRETFGKVENGLLDWGEFDVLPPVAQAEVPEAPLDKFTWAFARQVAANPLRITGAPGAPEATQDERFLFYRGLGNFDLPAQVTADKGGALSIKNTLAGDPVGTVFVLRVGKDGGAFRAHREGIAAGGRLAETAPSEADFEPMDSFVESLGEQVVDALDAEGLYHDEATAMVNTWKRQWFRTQGVRVLYLAPQSWTDASIPLTIQPSPEAMVRVMMIRVEVITKELEGADAMALAQLSDTTMGAMGKAYFRSLGRFAEPRLRRALDLAGHPAYGESFLEEVALAKTAVSAGE